MFSGLANHCARSRGNRARRGNRDRKAARREARTSAMKTGGRATAKASARLSARPLCKRSRVHLPVSCDKKSGISRVVPSPGRGPAVEILRASEKPPAPREKPARIAANGTSRKGAWFTSALEILYGWADDHLVDFH